MSKFRSLCGPGHTTNEKIERQKWVAKMILHEWVMENLWSLVQPFDTRVTIPGCGKFPVQFLHDFRDALGGASDMDHMVRNVRKMDWLELDRACAIGWDGNEWWWND